MPLHYGSQIQEHHFVRQQAGMFDVSHMGIVDLQGKDVQAYLRYLLANNIDRLNPGKALYTCMLNDQGGVIDDLIVYKITDTFYRLVINAGTREKDLKWMRSQLSSFQVEIIERSDLIMLAVQGPLAQEKLIQCLPLPDKELIHQLKPFTFMALGDCFIARTGYTGENGYEMIFPSSQAAIYWEACLNAGIHPCGLGARDTLRLEAGLNLYGSDMDETVTPLESNLAWTVMMEPQDRNFIGRQALQNQIQQGIKQQLIGLILDGSGIMRNHQKIFISDDGEGEVTSGGYSPTLEKSIGFARVPVTQTSKYFVEIRDKRIPAHEVKLPFVRYGKKMVLL